MKIIGGKTEIIGDTSRADKRRKAREMADMLGKCKDYAFFFETEKGIEYKSKDEDSFQMMMVFFKYHPQLLEVLNTFADEEE